MTQQQLNTLSSQIINAAIEVHKTLGPGLLERVYELCMVQELTARGIHVRRQVQQPITYKGVPVGEPLVIDLLVEESIVVELKAVETMHRLYAAQTLTYLRLANLRLGLLINFNVPRLVDGIERIVNHF